MIKALNISLFLMVLLIGCKKETLTPTSTSSDNLSLATSNRLSPSNITVSAEGFLVFPTMEEIIGFQDFLANTSHEEIQLYLDSLQFNSKGLSLYNDQTSEYYEATTPEQHIDYLFGEEMIVQVNDVVMKLTADSFLLTVALANYDVNAYAGLLSDNFDENVMNKFSTDRQVTENFDLFEFIIETPAGYEETQHFEGDKVPMFGTVTTQSDVTDPDYYDAYGNCLHAVHHYTIKKKYFFWMQVGNSSTYTGSTITAGTNC
jgi:hypothetical protein